MTLMTSMGRKFQTDLGTILMKQNQPFVYMNGPIFMKLPK